jgi:hypothetical protein
MAALSLSQNSNSSTAEYCVQDSHEGAIGERERKRKMARERERERGRGRE